MNRSSINPQKGVFTAREFNRKRRRLNLQPADQFDSEEDRTMAALRPHTTPLITRPVHDTLNTTARSNNFVHVRSISAVENQLQDRYREDMNSYLRNKLHKIIEKRQQIFIPEASFDATCDSNGLSIREKNSHPRRPLDYFYTSLNNESKLQTEKGVEEAYLLTAKQRIIRLIEMKKKKECQFKTLHNKIKVRTSINNEVKSKQCMDEFKKKAIEEQDWDRKWRDECISQNKRYRNRLLMKTNRQNNLFLSIDH